MNIPTESELERLAILAEECAEVQQVVMKIIRHGYDSHNPYDTKKTENRQLLNKELGDLSYIVHKMVEHADINQWQISKFEDEKRKNISKYLHHNIA